MTEDKNKEAWLSVKIASIMEKVGGVITSESMAKLETWEITLLVYDCFRREMLEGGLVQLIYNGYSGFVFLNPFAKVLREWGMKDLSKLVYEGRRLFELYGNEISTECKDDDEFMSLYEKYPEMDEVDDEFVDREEEFTLEIKKVVESIEIRG